MFLITLMILFIMFCIDPDFIMAFLTVFIILGFLFYLTGYSHY